MNGIDYWLFHKAVRAVNLCLYSVLTICTEIMTYMPVRERKGRLGGLFDTHTNWQLENFSKV